MGASGIHLKGPFLTSQLSDAHVLGPEEPSPESGSISLPRKGQAQSCYSAVLGCLQKDGVYVSAPQAPGVHKPLSELMSARSISMKERPLLGPRVQEEGVL